METRRLIGRILTIVLATVVLVVIACGVAAYKLLEASCGSRYGPEAVSPDGRYVAAIWDSDCGATTPVSTGVRLARVEESRPPSFRDKDDVVFVYGGYLSRTRMTWQEPDVLRIDHTGCNVSTQEVTWRDVQIVYDIYCSQRPP